MGVALSQFCAVPVLMHRISSMSNLKQRISSMSTGLTRKCSLFFPCSYNNLIFLYTFAITVVADRVVAAL